MKRLFALLLALTLCVGMLAGCEDKDDDKRSKKDKDEVQGEFFDAGNVKALVPKGWKAFPVADVFAEAEGATDPDAMTIVKDGKSELDIFTNPYIRIDYYGPETQMMGGFEEFYDQKTPVESMKLGTHNWQGFTTTDYGGVMAVLWSDEDPLQFQVSIQLEVEDGDKISLDDPDVQAILESIAASDGTTGGTAVEAPSNTPAEPEVSNDRWNESWYGWWCITDGTGDYAQFNDIAWDAYAITEADGDEGSILLWDSETSQYDPLMVGLVELTETTMTLSSGTFFQCDSWLEDSVTAVAQEMTWGNWAVDIEYSSVNHFENMIEITGGYVDPNNNANRFTYHIFLRPWGMKWDDVKNGETSFCLYSDMMPLYYDDWYLPLLEEGLTEPPVSFEEGSNLLR